KGLAGGTLGWGAGTDEGNEGPTWGVGNKGPAGAVGDTGPVGGAGGFPRTPLGTLGWSTSIPPASHSSALVLPTPLVDVWSVVLPLVTLCSVEFLAVSTPRGLTVSLEELQPALPSAHGSGLSSSGVLTSCISISPLDSVFIAFDSGRPLLDS